MLKRVLFSVLTLAFGVSTSYAEGVEKSSRTAEIKLNLPAGLCTVFNPSIEIGFAKQSAITFDYVGTFGESDFLSTGKSMLMTMNLFSYRHYMKSGSREGIYLCGDFGLTQYRMEKGAYPFVTNDHPDGIYDVGHGYVLGGTVGYKRYVGKHFSLEASLSAGFQHSRHEQYDSSGIRTHTFNASGEWTIYKAAINLGYRFWQ